MAIVVRSLRPTALQSSSAFVSVRVNSLNNPLRRAISNLSFDRKKQLEAYNNLTKASEFEKIEKIIKYYGFSDLSTADFSGSSRNHHYADLAARIKKLEIAPVRSIPGQSLPAAQADAEHFEHNTTFMNLPYSGQPQLWPDRRAMQQLLRIEKFSSQFFRDGDLAIVPGAADGQIPIEIYGNSLRNGVRLGGIVAADYNADAMALGYGTMQSFGLNPKAIQWLQGDATHMSFFRHVHENFPQAVGRYQVATLVQPSLREETLLAFLNNCVQSAKTRGGTTSILMPVLLNEASSSWRMSMDKYVNDALNQARNRNGANPANRWNYTRYGQEFQKYAGGVYVPNQYFINRESIPKIVSAARIEDITDKTLEEVGVPRKITSSNSERIHNIWLANRDEGSK